MEEKGGGGSGNFPVGRMPTRPRGTSREGRMKITDTERREVGKGGKDI